MAKQTAKVEKQTPTTGKVEKQTPSNDETKVEALPSVQLEKYIVTLEEDGVKMRLSALDIAEEAVKVQGLANQAKRKGGEFSNHMFALAALCKSVDEFRALCEEIAIRKMWGRPPKGTPKAQRMLWGELPAIFSVYKSQISKAWEDGIVPNGQLTQSLIEDGKVKHVTVKVDGINKLKTLHNELKKERKAKETDAKSAPGVHLEASGVSVAAEGKAPEISADVAALLGQVANLYATASEFMQDQVKERLAELVADLEADQ